MPDRWRTHWERMRPATTVLLGLIAAAALLAACGTDGGGVPVRATATGDSSTSLEPTRDASSTDTPPTDTPTDTPADGPTHGSPAFPEDTSLQTSRSAGGAPIVFTDVRVGELEGFDRIVLEFSGTGTPGWAVDYVDAAAIEGSGDVVTLGGDSILDIYASNTTWPASDYYHGPKRLRAENGGLHEVYVVGTFEGYTQVFAGIDGPRAPFRVVALIHPSRLVIDVVDDSVKPERDSTETLSPRTHKPSSWPIDVSYLAQTVRIQGHSAADDRQAVNVCTNIGNVHIHAWIDRVGIAREQRQGAGVVQRSRLPSAQRPSGTNAAATSGLSN